MSLADADSSSARHQQQADMRLVPGSMFGMGSDKHYPEEVPVHRVTVDGFWMDRTPVTNGEFRKFVNVTGYVTFVEIRPTRRTIPVLCCLGSMSACSKERVCFLRE
jgi:formylglycine-generating enzyme